MAQARAYGDLSSIELGDMLKQAQTAQLSYPVPVLRAREIDRWTSLKDYESLLAGNRSVGYYRENQKGGWRNW
ncbi:MULTISPECIES: hypothetical protein [unclassified Microcoleus]|uniref:hypothetical protein n=1 Tax=unclassified Microcoleus TaxID=2642155 RepID=UPI002FD67BFC